MTTVAIKSSASAPSSDPLSKTDSSDRVKQDVVECQLSFTPTTGLEGLSPQKCAVQVNFVADLKNMEKDPEVVCYMTINECAQLNHKVDELMKSRKTEEAVALKKQIIEKYEAVLGADRFGIIGALMENEKHTMNVLIKEGLTDRTRKTQDSSSSMGYTQTTSAAPAAWEKKKKNVTYADTDLGYAMFTSANPK